MLPLRIQLNEAGSNPFVSVSFGADVLFLPLSQKSIYLT
jgi:hypothetical protein